MKDFKDDIYQFAKDYRDMYFSKYLEECEFEIFFDNKEISYKIPSKLKKQIDEYLDSVRIPYCKFPFWLTKNEIYNGILFIIEDFLKQKN